MSGKPKIGHPEVATMPKEFTVTYETTIVADTAQDAARFARYGKLASAMPAVFTVKDLLGHEQVVRC